MTKEEILTLLLEEFETNLSLPMTERARSDFRRMYGVTCARLFDKPGLFDRVARPGLKWVRLQGEHADLIARVRESDVVDVEQATRITARYLRDNPPAQEDLYPAGTGPFDYEREDLIVESWRHATANFEAL